MHVIASSWEMMIQMEMRKMIGNGYLKSDMRAFHTKWRRARAPWLLVKFIPLGGNKFLEDYGCSFLRSFCLRGRGRVLDLRNLSPKKADDLNLEETWKKTWGSEALQFVSAPSQVPDWGIEFQGRLVSVGRRRAQLSSHAVKVEGKHKKRVVGFPKLSS